MDNKENKSQEEINNILDRFIKNKKKDNNNDLENQTKEILIKKILKLEDENNKLKIIK